MPGVDFRTEEQKVRTFVFLINTIERMRDELLSNGDLETAAEYQEQIKTLKGNLFELFLNDKYSVDIEDSGNVAIRVKQL